MTTIVAIVIGVGVYLIGLFVLFPVLKAIDGGLALLAFCWPPGLALAILAADYAHKLIFRGRPPALKRPGAVLLVCLVGLGGLAALVVSRWPVSP